MPRPRPDAVFIPKVSWTARNAPSTVAYGALVGTPSTIILLPRSGTETAGFTLTLQWSEGGVTADDIQRFLSDAERPLSEIEATLIDNLPEWQTRCVFPVAELSRLEVLSGWKLWLGLSAVLQVGEESPVSLRVANKAHLGELREMYRDAQRRR